MYLTIKIVQRNKMLLTKLCIVLQIAFLWLSQVCFCDDISQTTSTSYKEYNENENDMIRDNLFIIKKVLNSNVNPCENFFEYACGNYINDTRDIGIFPNIADNKYIELAFADQSALFESALKAKDFYLSCLRRGNLCDILSKVNVLQDSIKNWPILNENSIIDSRAWMRISEELKLIDLDPILEISYDDFNMVEVFTGLHGIHTLSENNEKDIEELTKTLIQFGTSKDNVQRVVQDIENFTRSQQKIFQLSDECAPPCDEDRWITLNLYYDMKTFKHEFLGIDWNEYFKMLFGRVFNDTEPIKIRRQKTTKPYLDLLVRTDMKTITNYVVWTLIKGLQKLGTVEDSCGGKTFGFFESVLTAVYSKFLFNNNDRQRYLDILNRFENAFEYSKDRFNVPHQRNLLYILRKEKRYISNLDSVFSISKLNQDFENVTIDPNNYFQNLINLGQQRKCNLIERECMDRLDLMMFIFEIASLHNKPTYFSFSNKYYYLWESIIQHCYTRRRLNVTKFEEIKQCALVQGQILNFEDGVSDKSVIVNAALKQTFEDYKRWLSVNNENNKISHSIFQEFELNIEKAFFLNFVQGHCNQGNKIKQNILQSLINMEEFSNVFECKLGSLMNLENKCTVW